MFLAQEVPALPVYGFDPSISGLINLVVVFLLPLLVGLVTRSSTSSGVKAVLLLFFSALSSISVSLAQSVQDEVEFLFIPVVYTTTINFVIAVAVHFGLWKPTGASEGAQRALVTD